MLATDPASFKTVITVPIAYPSSLKSCKYSVLLLSFLTIAFFLLYQQPKVLFGGTVEYTPTDQVNVLGVPVAVLPTVTVVVHYHLMWRCINTIWKVELEGVNVLGPSTGVSKSIESFAPPVALRVMSSLIDPAVIVTILLTSVLLGGLFVRGCYSKFQPYLDQ